MIFSRVQARHPRKCVARPGLLGNELVSLYRRAFGWMFACARTVIYQHGKGLREFLNSLPPASLLLVLFVQEAINTLYLGGNSIFKISRDCAIYFYHK